MKLKNTLGLAIGALVAATSFGVLAQGQGAVEVEASGARDLTNSSRNLSNGYLVGGSVGYFLTDDVELALDYHGIRDMNSDNGTGGKSIHGADYGLQALYHFGTPGPGLRPYINAGVEGQSRTNVPDRTGRDHSTYLVAGGGAKYYFTDNFYARAGVDVMYNIDRDETEYAPIVGIGMNFGGGSKKVEEAAAPAPAPTACVDSDNDGVCDNVDKCPNTPANTTVDADGCPAVAEVVRVELDVKFDFDKSVVKPNSYGDIKNLADFMKQYPATTTTVEGHTDSVGPDAYNQKLSERRANAVKAVLVNQYGVQGTRVKSVGYGASRPVADNKTDAGRAINRRVEAEVEAQPAAK